VVSLDPNPERTRQQNVTTRFLAMTFMVVALCWSTGRNLSTITRSGRRADRSNFR
jgi:hypothetical protein